MTQGSRPLSLNRSWAVVRRYSSRALHTSSAAGGLNPASIAEPANELLMKDRLDVLSILGGLQPGNNRSNLGTVFVGWTANLSKDPADMSRTVFHPDQHRPSWLIRAA
jgi:hypothetical protein